MSFSLKRSGVGETSGTESAAMLWLGGVSVLGLALLALTVARLARWWAQPLGPGSLALLALWWMAAGTLLRYGGQAAAQRWPQLQPWHLPLGTGLVVWGSLLISFPGTPAVALVFYWLWVLLAETAGWGFWCLRRSRRQSPGHREATPAVPPLPRGDLAESRSGGLESPSAPVAPAPEAENTSSDPMDNPQVLQHWQHWDEGTRQRWSGWVRVRRCAGENSATVHVAFCPPMDEVPEVHCEPVAGAEAEVELVRVYAHGAQLRLRWLATDAHQPEAPSWTVVALEAVAHASSGDSARAA